MIAILILLGAHIYKTWFQLMKWAYLAYHTGGETRVNFRCSKNFISGIERIIESFIEMNQDLEKEERN